MKNTILTLFMLLLVVAVKAQTTTETRALNAFDQIAVSDDIEVELIKGENHEITITASGIDISQLSTKINKRELEIEVSGNNPKSSSIKAVITYVQLNEIEVSSGAKVFVKDLIENKTIDLKVASNAYLEVEVKAERLVLAAETNAKMFIKGSADHLDYNAFTNAEIDGEGLVVKNVEIRTNTNASGSFEVLESLKGTAATRGRVRYKGNPNIIDVKENIGGTIEQF
ncbi:head GIN domain-containing protein [uncultured Cyclobacterium sp.]|uniref:head GIN domain-containing protein n=1 Tax=uncultured Cyclobacterium sp. TaxID=453820 RepID=UPI0030EB77D2|tara:strand:+ start:55960 stop:56640 length:681 start_codon:yes stop_codon:yes gene_type:complete